ncbi:putative Ran-binding protein [Corchorus capsularis]|uniref:Putative Ran-binding protein n=1 Tax=Corchorus capsularis TaxID=210143 RepID=A0A1R3JLH7_COCAP|nr:putative Ran-binding protein [Corchorus capsularis]
MEKETELNREREWPQASKAELERRMGNADGLESGGCWIPQSNIISSAAPDSVSHSNTLTFPPSPFPLSLPPLPSSFLPSNLTL